MYVNARWLDLLLEDIIRFSTMYLLAGDFSETLSYLLPKVTTSSYTKSFYCQSPSQSL